MKRFSFILALLVALTLCFFTLSSCDEEDSVQDEIEENDEQDEKEDKPQKEKQDDEEDNVEDKTPVNKFVGATSTDMDVSGYLVRAKLPGEELYGYVDVRTGEFAIQPAFDYADVDFGNDGWAEVSNDLEQYNIINTNGELLFEYGTVKSITEFEDDVIVVTKNDDTIHLYHGANYIKQFEVPSDATGGFSTTLAYSKSKNFYTPEKFICIRGRDDNDDVFYYWYDKDGDFIYKADRSGALAGDDTGYYYFGDSSVDKIGLDGTLIETVYTGRVGNVEYDGENWYAFAGSDLYTNGMNVFVDFPEYSDSGRTVLADNGIVTVGDTYRTPDGQRFYAFTDFDYRYGFQNGYAKVLEGGPNSYGGDFNGYIDTQGNSVFEITDYDNFDSYTSVLKDGYFVYGKDNLYGVMKLDGTVVIGPTYRSLYVRENGKHVS